MKKPDALKAVLVGAIRELALNPDRLQIYVDKGRLVMRAGSLSYEQHYRLQLLVTDFAAEPEALFVPLLAWLSRHQRELFLNLGKANDALKFEVDILSDEKVDVAIEVDLSERVRVVAVEGGYTIEYLDEPQAEEDLPAGSDLHRLVANGELLLRCEHEVEGE